MTRRADWPHLPPEPERVAWVAWFTRHGVTPGDVAVAPGWVEADDDARTITFLGFDRDEDGYIRIDDTGMSTRKAPRVVQLEAPALPFPGQPHARRNPSIADVLRRSDANWPPP